MAPNERLYQQWRGWREDVDGPKRLHPLFDNLVGCLAVGQGYRSVPDSFGGGEGFVLVGVCTPGHLGGVWRPSGGEHGSSVIDKASYQPVADPDPPRDPDRQRAASRRPFHPGEGRVGADDAWIPTQTGRRLADLIPDAGYTEVADAGHLIQDEAPVALGNVVRAWLTEQAGLLSQPKPPSP